MSNVIQMPKVSRSTFYSPILTFMRLCYKPHLKVCPQNNFCIISRELMNRGSNFDREESVHSLIEESEGETSGSENKAPDADLNPQ